MNVPVAKPALSESKILEWSDAYLARFGRWPSDKSGFVLDAPRPLLINWKTIDSALKEGRYGLPGGSSLARLLAAKRNRLFGSSMRRLSADEIVRLACDHHRRTGRWPQKASGPVFGLPGKTWSGIHQMLTERGDAEFRRTTLSDLLTERVGRPTWKTAPALTIDQILKWADAHNRRTGRWPITKISAGPVLDAPRENWWKIHQALLQGGRSLPPSGGLAKLLDKHRNVRNKANLPLLTKEQILTWADEHFARTGKWPHTYSGPVHGVPNEKWNNIDSALFYNRRKLRFGDHLAMFLAKYRGRRHLHHPPRLTYKKILAWADAHYERTGDWPSVESGPIPQAPSESWSRVFVAMKLGTRGLRKGYSLIKLLADKRGRPYPRRGLALKRSEILDWAGTHLELYGSPPTNESGPVRDVPGETWAAIDASLRFGSRGLRGTISLADFLAEHDFPAGPSVGRRLSERRIIQWAEEFKQRVGYWPTRKSAYTDPTRAEKWITIDIALREGLRGLPGGTSLTKLLRAHRKRVSRVPGTETRRT